jgi:ABC-type glycerol-3-phosphate transport system substrate-binding protein
MQRFARLNILLIIAATLISACSKPVVKRQSVPEQPQSEAGPVTIKAALWGTPIESTGLDAVIAAFQNKFPQYRVEKVPIPRPADPNDPTSWDSAENSLNQMLKKGEVDLAGVGITSGAVEQGLLVDLMPLIQRSRVDMKPFATFMNDWQQGNHVFVMPYAVSPSVLAYNKDRVSAAGVAIPKDTWTWDQFRQTAARLTQGTGSNRLPGLDNLHVESLGLMWYQQATQHLNRTQVEAASGYLQYFNGMLNLDHSMLQPPPPTEGSVVTFGLDFKEGRAWACPARRARAVRVSRGDCALSGTAGGQTSSASPFGDVRHPDSKCPPGGCLGTASVPRQPGGCANAGHGWIPPAWRRHRSP